MGEGGGENLPIEIFGHISLVVKSETAPNLESVLEI